MPVPVIAQDFPQHKDVLGKIAFFYETFWPKSAHQLFFFHQTPAALQQKNQGIEDLGPDRDRIAVTQEKSKVRVQTEGTELVN
ncbi:MAG TPA: hypothetical protein VFT65_14650 [Candidatus Angelobacter sp.]|nr:hypothetical protein [Candidatus Angelobacter sp.]